MNLSQVSWLLAAVHGFLGAWMLMRGAAAGAVLRSLARNVPVGVLLMLAGTAWFVGNLYRSDLTDFAEWRPVMYGGFSLLGIGCCIFVRDYLFVRGLAVVALLGCDRVLDIQRWHPSPAKNVVTVWAYLVICLAVWFSMSPWRFRDAMDWLATAPGRLRAGGGALLAAGFLLAVLAVLAFR